MRFMSMRAGRIAALREIKRMQGRFKQVGAMDAPALSRELFALNRELAKSGAFGAEATFRGLRFVGSHLLV